MKRKKIVYIYSFYRFKVITNKKKIKSDFEILVNTKHVKGTILLANEGINGTISGSLIDLKNAIAVIKKLLNIKKISLKINRTDFHPFNRFKIRLKKEIVTLGIKNLNTATAQGKYLKPSQWDQFTIDKSVRIIDVRNEYETQIGRFNNSLEPKTNSFREFPIKFKRLNLQKNENIAMYCTGGIRCEKAAMFLRAKGYKKIYQLEGGILNYLSYKPKSAKLSNWQGECFVFDQRVTVNKKLIKGKYLQCFGCRRPITIKDTESSKYEKGVTCHQCYIERNEFQISKSKMRQRQILLGNIKKN